MVIEKGGEGVEGVIITDSTCFIPLFKFCAIKKHKNKVGDFLMLVKTAGRMQNFFFDKIISLGLI
jgi:hypothetical protein